MAGNFSAFWKGILIAGLMGGAFFVSQLGSDKQQGLNSLMQVELMKPESLRLEKLDKDVKAKVTKELLDTRDSPLPLAERSATLRNLDPVTRRGH